MSNGKRTTIALEYPFPEERVFRYQGMQDVLALLVEEHHEEFTVGELATMVDADQSTVSRAVRLLSELGCVRTHQDGRKRYVRIDREHLTKSDPILSIPQPEFHAPVRAFLDRLRDEIDGVVGVLLFGSVARGEADRASDVDVLVVVEDDRTRARRTVQAIVSEIEGTTFERGRYGFEVLVESTGSALRIGERLRRQFDGGITLLGSETFSEIRKQVHSDGE